MLLTFLGSGTSQGVPVIACRCAVCQSDNPHDKRLRSSVLVTLDDGKNILIDIGPDFREQMLRERVDHLDAILITHPHRDHVGGLDDIRSFNYVQNKPMDVYANEETITALQRDYHYIFESHEFPGLPEVNIHRVDNTDSFEVGSQQIVPVHCMHKTMPILGYRIGDLAYITDANYISPEELLKLKGVKVLVINALRKEKHFSHYSLPEALEIIRQIKPQQAFLTHVSHQMGLHQEVSSILPPDVAMAYDTLKVQI